MTARPRLLLLAVALTGAVVASKQATCRLPDGFLFGAGTSSYQTEGAWAQEGKGVNVFDHVYHKNRSAPNGDVACDSYNRYKEDIKLAAELQLNVFRFSISWARIFPNGKASEVNQQGVEHYHNVIDELLRHNIKPLVTIYHYDHPQALEDDFGGWQSEKMVDAFVSYADFVFKEYGNKVDLWNTINEVNFHCSLVYSGQLAPGVAGQSDARRVYKCIHHEILAHARAYRLYQAKYKRRQQGLLGIGASSLLARPNSTSTEDIQAAYRANIFDVSILLHPLVYGDYPPLARRTLESKGRGSDLPRFSSEQKNLLIGANDFLGMNAYTGRTVAHRTSSSTQGGSQGGLLGSLRGPIQDCDVVLTSDVQETPWLLRDAPLWVQDHYNTSVFITENGRSSPNDKLNDWKTRASYHSRYLRVLARTISEHNVRVMGYTAWAFLDSFEFSEGFRSEEGIVYVDHASGSLRRELKASASFFKSVARTHVVPAV